MNDIRTGDLTAMFNLIRDIKNDPSTVYRRMTFNELQRNPAYIRLERALRAAEASGQNVIMVTKGDRTDHTTKQKGN